MAENEKDKILKTFYKSVPSNGAAPDQNSFRLHSVRQLLIACRLKTQVIGMTVAHTQSKFFQFFL